MGFYNRFTVFEDGVVEYVLDYVWLVIHLIRCILSALKKVISYMQAMSVFDSSIETGP